MNPLYEEKQCIILIKKGKADAFIIVGLLQYFSFMVQNDNIVSGVF